MHSGDNANNTINMEKLSISVRRSIPTSLGATIIKIDHRGNFNNKRRGFDWKI